MEEEDYRLLGRVKILLCSTNWLKRDIRAAVLDARATAQVKRKEEEQGDDNKETIDQEFSWGSFVEVFWSNRFEKRQWRRRWDLIRSLFTEGSAFVPPCSTLPTSCLSSSAPHPKTLASTYASRTSDALMETFFQQSTWCMGVQQEGFLATPLYVIIGTSGIFLMPLDKEQLISLEKELLDKEEDNTGAEIVGEHRLKWKMNAGEGITKDFLSIGCRRLLEETSISSDHQFMTLPMKI
ncbi:hypothetical protein CBL_12914 [Carabus blaptoides fortunei]